MSEAVRIFGRIPFSGLRADRVVGVYWINVLLTQSQTCGAVSGFRICFIINILSIFVSSRETMSSIRVYSSILLDRIPLDSSSLVFPVIFNLCETFALGKPVVAYHVNHTGR
jgi:hypothetical protein